MLNLPLQFILDFTDGAFEGRLGGHIVTGRKNGGALETINHLAAQRVDLADGINFVPEKLNAQSPFFLVGGKHLNAVTAHPKGATVEIDIVAFILDLHQSMEKVVTLQLHPGTQINEHTVVGFRRTEAIDTANGSDDQHIAA